MNDPKSTKVTKEERRAWSIAEVAARLGVSRHFILAQISRGALRARRLGRRVVVLTEDLESYLAGAEQVCGK